MPGCLHALCHQAMCLPILQTVNLVHAMQDLLLPMKTYVQQAG